MDIIYAHEARKLVQEKREKDTNVFVKIQTAAEKGHSEITATYLDKDERSNMLKTLKNLGYTVQKSTTTGWGEPNEYKLYISW